MPELNPSPTISRSPQVSASQLVAVGCGTAVASVCAIGMLQIERLLGGLWSVAAVLVAGGCCYALARAFGRLSEVVPSGASLLAFLSRGLGKRAGLLVAGPYLLLTLFLVGAEATIVGTLVQKLTGLPLACGALAFLIGTWAVCRAGIQIGYRAQSVATWALLAGLVAVSVYALVVAGERGELATRLLTRTPSAIDFISGIGQAFFLFMGFELLTSQAEVVRSPGSIGQGLRVSVLVLIVFYGLLSLGFSALDAGAFAGSGQLVPQVAVADATRVPGASIIVASLVLLSSFTSFNGALLGLSRFGYALAAQKVLPRSLARLDPKTMVPRDALSALLALSMVFTALVAWGGLLDASILAAAVAASLMYAGSAIARERPPFHEQGRRKWRTLSAFVLALGMVLLGIGVIADAGAARTGALALLGVAASLAAWAARRIGANSSRPRPAPTPSTQTPTVSPLVPTTGVAHGD
jgi:amino acid transporter